VVRILHDAFRAALEDPSTAALLARFSKPNLYLDSAAYAASVREQIEAEREGLRQVGMLARP
jgi:tripartite-type tricarboxylate transporter receptor subunit TctC